MERCGRRRNAAGYPREDRLIAHTRLVGLVANVRRKRQAPGAHEKRLQRLAQPEFDFARSIVERAHDGRGGVVVEIDARAGAQPTRRLDQRNPARSIGAVAVRSYRVEQQQLDPAAGRNAPAAQTRRYHPRLVEYQQVAGTQIARQIGKDGVFEPHRPRRPSIGSRRACGAGACAMSSAGRQKS